MIQARRVVTVLFLAFLLTWAFASTSLAAGKVVLSDGRVLAATKAPLIAFGEVRYQSADGRWHVLKANAVDIAATRRANGSAARSTSTVITAETLRSSSAGSLSFAGTTGTRGDDAAQDRARAIQQARQRADLSRFTAGRRGPGFPTSTSRDRFRRQRTSGNRSATSSSGQGTYSPVARLPATSRNPNEVGQQLSSPAGFRTDRRDLLHTERAWASTSNRPKTRVGKKSCRKTRCSRR